MNKDRETYFGSWWLPSNPTKRVYGELTIHHEHLSSLELQGSLSVDDHAEFEKYDVIVGETRSGQKITLRQCQVTDLVNRGWSSETTVIASHMVLINDHFARSEDIMLVSTSIQYDHVGEWMAENNFQVNHETFSKINVSYEAVPGFVARTDIGQITIRTTPQIGTSRDALTISEETWVSIEYDKPTPIDDCMRSVRHIQNFLTLAVGSAVFPIKARGRVDRNNTKDEDFTLPVEIYFPLYRRREGGDKVHFFDMTFTMSDVKDKFESVIQKWLVDATVLEPVRNLCFAALYNPTIYLETKFLNLAQALETYHQRVVGGELQTKKQYEPTLEAINKWINENIHNPEVRRGLIDRVRYGNEYSFAHRIEKLWQLGIETNDLAFKDNLAAEVFIQQVKNTRNYQTHWTVALEPKSIKDTALHVLTQQMRALLEILLLMDIGFDKQKIQEIILQRRRWSSLLMVRPTTSRSTSLA